MEYQNEPRWNLEVSSYCSNFRGPFRRLQTPKDPCWKCFTSVEAYSLKLIHWIVFREYSESEFQSPRICERWSRLDRISETTNLVKLWGLRANYRVDLNATKLLSTPALVLNCHSKSSESEVQTNALDIQTESDEEVHSVHSTPAVG